MATKLIILEVQYNYVKGEILKGLKNMYATKINVLLKSIDIFLICNVNEENTVL